MDELVMSFTSFANINNSFFLKKKRERERPRFEEVRKNILRDQMKSP